MSRYLEAANRRVMGIALHHDLDVLHRLLPHRPGAGHFISHFLCSFLQLSITTNCQRRTIEVNKESCEVTELISGAVWSSAQTHQWEVLRGQLVETVGQILLKAGEVLHLHLHPVLPQGVVSLQLISEHNKVKTHQERYWRTNLMMPPRKRTSRT